MRGRLLGIVALAGMALLPAACGGAPEQEAPEQEPLEQDRAFGVDPEAPAGVAVSNARMMLPPVAGNPAAVYFDIANGSAQALTIRSANVQGAGMTMLHTSEGGAMKMVDEQPVSAGETVRFEPGGLHLMASDLAENVVPGGQAEITLTFESGDKVSFPAEIRAAGDAR